jgi:hypothetical protein
MSEKPTRQPPPVEPSTLAEHEEAVRQRLVQHGQHGALAAFGKYTAAVHERLNGPISTSVGSAGTADGKVSPPATAGAVENQAKPKAKKAKAKK